MTPILVTPNNSEIEPLLNKRPYLAPQLMIIPPLDIENNEGFASDAGLDVGAS